MTPLKKRAISGPPFEFANPYEGEYHVAAYDVETYPNYFCAVFIGPKNVPKVYTMENLDQLRADLNNPKLILIGFNNNNFDDYVLKLIVSKPAVTCREIYELADDIIAGDSNKRSKLYWNLWRMAPPWAFSLDAFAVPNAKIGLKERAAKRNWKKIQDLPIAPGSTINAMQRGPLVKYCENDVRVTIAEWNDAQEHFAIRRHLAEQYPGTDVLSKHDAGVCEEIITTLYCQRTGQMKKFVKSQIPKGGGAIAMCDAVPDLVDYDSDVLTDLLGELLGAEGKFVYDGHEKQFTIDGQKFYKNFDLQYLNINLGSGGLHTNDKPMIEESDAKSVIVDVDVASYYPNIIRALELRPKHLGPEFNEILEAITTERLAAKAAGEKVKADGMKIVINSAFGKTGNKYSILFDELVQLQVTLAGQLMILMLIESLLKAKIKILSANTDGVLVKLPRMRLPQLKKIMRGWERTTGQALEDVEYSKYIRRDVNNYIAVKADGTTKEKGVFKKHIRGKAPIIAEAVRKYFIDGIEPLAWIEVEDDVRRFIFYAHVSGKFKLKFDQGARGDTPLQNTSRWYVSKGVALVEGVGYYPSENSGRVIKFGEMTENERLRYKNTHGEADHPNNWIKSERIANGANAVMINNAIPERVPEDLNRNYYIRQAQEIINSIRHEACTK